MFKFGFGPVGDFNKACMQVFAATESSCETCDVAIADMAENGLSGDAGDAAQNHFNGWHNTAIRTTVLFATLHGIGERMLVGAGELKGKAEAIPESVGASCAPGNIGPGSEVAVVDGAEKLCVDIQGICDIELTSLALGVQSLNERLAGISGVDSAREAAEMLASDIQTQSDKLDSLKTKTNDLFSSIAEFESQYANIIGSLGEAFDRSKGGECDIVTAIFDYEWVSNDATRGIFGGVVGTVIEARYEAIASGIEKATGLGASSSSAKSQANAARVKGRTGGTIISSLIEGSSAFYYDYNEGLSTRSEGRRFTDSLVEGVVAGGLTTISMLLGSAFGTVIGGPVGLGAGAAAGYGIGVGFSLGKESVLSKRNLDGYSTMDVMKNGFYDLNMKNVVPIEWGIG